MTNHSLVLAFEEETCQDWSAGTTNSDIASMEIDVSESTKMKSVKMFNVMVKNAH